LQIREPGILLDAKRKKEAMNTRTFSVSLATLAAAMGVTASWAGATDTAEVVAAVPVYERVATPRQQCYDESVPVTRTVRQVRHVETRDDYHSPSVGPGAVVGAVLGGAVGRQFGNSTGGRDRGTVVGAVIGGLIGSQVERDARHNERVVYDDVPVRETQYRTVSRCQTVNDYRDEVRAYDVTYRYLGREYRTQLPYDPGRTLQVRVDVTPERAARPYRPVTPQYNRPGYDGQRWN
jgi:uncharacterized protein YcfJ